MVVGILALGATIAIKAYQWMLRLGPTGQVTIDSIKTQAAVIGTLAGAVFSVIEALVKMKLVLGSTSASQPTFQPGGFGYGNPGFPTRQVVPTTVT